MKYRAKKTHLKQKHQKYTNTFSFPTYSTSWLTTLKPKFRWDLLTFSNDTMIYVESYVYIFYICVCIIYHDEQRILCCHWNNAIHLNTCCLCFSWSFLWWWRWWLLLLILLYFFFNPSLIQNQTHEHSCSIQAIFQACKTFNAV